MTVAFIGIGNSDNKLTQREWVSFQLDMRMLLQSTSVNILGDWLSLPDSIYLNACWCIEIDSEKVPELKGDLAALATLHRQDAIAWNEVTATEFLGAQRYTLSHPNSDRWTGGDRKDEP
jgi:hypothetical protein